MKLNIKSLISRAKTHEGGPAFAPKTPEAKLRRMLMSCFLWEDQFYVDGQEIAVALSETAAQVEPEVLAAMIVEARTVHNLRHAPLLLLTVLIKTASGRQDGLVARTIGESVQRADELAELLTLYWKDGKKPLSGQLKKGLALAFGKFDGYQLAKYNRDAPVKLRDVLFLAHAKPKDEAQKALWQSLIDGSLKSPDTWEVELSAGKDKRETFERLIREQKLGYLALLRNLRNMTKAGCDTELVGAALRARKGAQRVLPFRYVAAVRHAPAYTADIDTAFKAALAEMPPVSGATAILIDVSGSMDAPLSRKSDMNRIDAAAALAAIWPGRKRLFTFSNEIVEVPGYDGLAVCDAIIASQPHGGTELGKAVTKLNDLTGIDRLIVITDEQSADVVPAATAKRAYMVNVASYKNGVAYGPWIKVDGFSESIVKWIVAAEADVTT